jgi:glycosyltransferase involved in cell wall biosynthesis
VKADRLILLAPIEPARSGNGLAMRTELFRRAAPPGLDVLTVVVPVAGRLPAPRPAPGVAVVPADPTGARTGVAGLIGQPSWRERLARASPLPPLARAASPGLSEAVVRACSGGGRAALHVMRSYLAPLGLAVAERLGPAWTTLDLDDDDAAVAASLGDLSAAAAYDRLLGVFGANFAALSAASVTEAKAMTRRHGLAVEHVPNAIDLPDQREPRPPDREYVSLLFVGNLTYAPNAEAASVLVEAILPRVERRLSRRVRVTLVGRHHPGLKRLIGPNVELAGFVSDLGPRYAAADVVVVPLKHGGGTRIKLLEAFAWGVPVVASRAAAAGLEAVGGEHLLFAEGPDETAAAVEAVLTDPGLAAGFVAQAQRLVRDRYCFAVVIPQIHEFFSRAEGRARGRSQVLLSP